MEEVDRPVGVVLRTACGVALRRVNLFARVAGRITPLHFDAVRTRRTGRATGVRYHRSIFQIQRLQTKH